MFGKVSTLISSIFFLLACARPTYIEGTSATTGTLTGDKLTCQYSFINENLCFAFTWEKIPHSTTDSGTIILKTFRLNQLDQSPIIMNPQGIPNLYLFMTGPNMNHGSAPTHLETVDVGTYRIKNIYFIMTGDWLLKFQILKSGVITDETVIPFTF